MAKAGLIAWLFMVCCIAAAGVALAQQAPGSGHGFLIDKHLTAGVNCASCHTEKPPAKAAADSACAKCHTGPNGQFVGVGAKQYAFDGGVTVTVNPHQPHFIEIPCGECHHVHAASVNFCEQCHLMKDMKVP